jgi:hypothetical protein
MRPTCRGKARTRGILPRVVPTPRPRVALWGRFDVARFGELLLPRIHEVELRRRLRGLRVLPHAPLGPDHPIALDGGLGALALGAWSPERAGRIASAADAVIVSGSDVLTGDDEALGADYGLSAEDARRRRLSGFFLEGAPTTTAWSAVGAPFELGKTDAARLRGSAVRARYLSVRDEESRRRLERAGIERDAIVVPDPVSLARRVFEPDVLAKRLNYLQFMEWFPRAGAPIVVQGSRALVPHAASLAAALTGVVAGRTVPLILVETEPADGSEFAEALLPGLSMAFRLPTSASLVDLVAVFAGARGFLGDSIHGHVAALAFGVPSLFLSAGAFPPALATFGNCSIRVASPSEVEDAMTRLLGQPREDRLPGSIEARLDAHFDALAEVAEIGFLERLAREEAAGGRKGSMLLKSLEDTDRLVDIATRAWEARSEQLAAARLSSAEELEKLESRLEDAGNEKTRLETLARAKEEETASLRRQLAALQADRERLAAELDRLAGALGSASEENVFLREELSRRLGELEAMRAEFVRFTNLRLFRYSAPLRRVYTALRRLAGRASR